MDINNKLKVVLDTNVLLVSVSSKSKYHWVFEKLFRHFRTLENIEFPKIRIADLESFRLILLGEKISG
jgi:hypothetical protein